MPSFTPRHGYVLVVPDDDETKTKSGILFSDNMRRKRASGFALIHNVASYWAEDLTGQHVLFEKWSWKEFTLDGREFWLIPERAVFAVVEPTEGEVDMNRSELLNELQDRIKTLVEDEVDNPTTEVTQDHIDAIESQIDGNAQAAFDALQGAEDEADAENESELPADEA